MRALLFREASKADLLSLCVAILLHILFSTLEDYFAFFLLRLFPSLLANE